MDIKDFKKILKTIDIYNTDEYDSIVNDLKHNICQNMRIARKITKMKPDEAAVHLGLEPQSLRRIEAENDRDEFSSKVLIMAIITYNVDANFYFKDWRDNEKLLDD